MDPISSLNIIILIKIIMHRHRSKSADTNDHTEAIQILLTIRLELLCNLKYFNDHHLTHFISETEQRLLTNKRALCRLLTQNEIDTLIDSPNEILSIARYLKQYIPSKKPDVLQYLIKMYEVNE
jgi:hypothetical protein